MSAHEEILTETTTTTCKNCETVFEGNFCPNCSQRANTHRFTLKHFAHEVFHAITHADKGILFLVKKLFRWPGIVAREYVNGKRKKYFNPITFLLLTMALQLYAVKKTDFYNQFIDSTREMVEGIATLNKKNNKAPAESIQSLEKAKTQSAKTMENSKTMTFLFLPVLALLTWLFFSGSGMNYTENLIMAIFAQGQMNLFFLVICIVPMLIYPPIVVGILYVYMVAMWAYSMIVYRQFFRQGKWATVWKGSIAMILYYAISRQIVNLVLDYL